MCIFVPSTCASEDPPHFKSHFTNAHYAGLQLPLAITVSTCPWQALLLQTDHILSH